MMQMWKSRRSAAISLLIILSVAVTYCYFAVYKYQFNSAYGNVIVQLENINISNVQVEQEQIQQPSQNEVETDNNSDASLTLTERDTLTKTQRIFAKIRDNCEAKGLHYVWNFEDSFSRPRKLIARDRNKILYACNPKAGSTSFKKFLFHLDGDFEHKDFHGAPLGHFRFIKSFKNEEQVNSYVKIAIIRNPIVRVISAFRNKQLEHRQFFKPEPNMTDVDEFVHFVRTRLKRESESNPHLTAQWKQLDICQFPYDIIVHFEDCNRYLDLFRKLTNTTHVPFPGSRVDIGKDVHDSLYYVDRYFGSLSQADRDIVYRKYFMDFEILGYSLYEDSSFPYLKFDNEI